MKINAIGVQNYHSNFYNKHTAEKKQTTPSFGATYEYNPITPAGKVITAVSAAALIAAMVAQCTHSSEDPNNNPNQNVEVYDSLSPNRSYYSEQHEDKPDKNTLKIEVVEPENPDTLIDDTTFISVNDSIIHSNDSDSVKTLQMHVHKHSGPAKADTIVILTDGKNKDIRPHH